MLMHWLFSGESVNELQYNGSGTITIEYLRCCLCNHRINDLCCDWNSRAFVVRYNTEKLEVEDIEGI